MAFVKALVRRAMSMPVLLCMFICPATHAATAEYQLEAVFLFNFTQFVEWPADAFAHSDSPLAICVLGEDPFGTSLDDIVRGESVRGHPLMVEHYHNAEDARHCHIVFFSRSETGNVQLALQKLKDTNVLTVGN
ncbi:MAG: YfiR family protein, partial [Steroidobacter sp.]